jgi:hypothetical protein
MIEVDFTPFAATCLGLCLALVVLFSWISRSVHEKRERRARRKHAVCRLCLAVFEADGRLGTHRCPHCDAETGNEGPTPLG